MKLSYFASEQTKMPRAIEVSWEQLAAQLSAPVLTPCTLTTCPGKSCGHKLGPAWSPAVYPEGAKRGKRNVAEVSCIVLDLDHMTDEQVLDVAHKLAPYRYIAHATHTDRAGDRCLRVVLELSAPVPGFDWPRFYRTALVELGIPMEDKKADTGGQDAVTFDASRLYFLPSRPNDADYLSTTNEGAAVDVAAIMAKAPTPEEAVAPSSSPVAPVAPANELHAAALQLAAVFPAKGRHSAFLALAGALAGHGWSEDQITELTVAVAHLLPYDTAQDKEKALADRPLMARDSIGKVQRGESVTGWGTFAQALTRPEAVDYVRERLNMRDPASVAIDAVFGPLSVPNSGNSVPDSGIGDVYPSLDALAVLDVPRAPAASLMPPAVTAPVGTYAHALQTARLEIAGALGSSDMTGKTNEVPLFFAAREMFVKTYGPTPWLVQGLIVEGGIAAIIGEPKSTKSWMAIDIAACVASGVEALGKFKVPRATRVAYFFAEDLEQSIRNRLRAFAAGRGMRPEDFASNLYVQPRGRHLDVTKDEDLAQIIASCRMIGQVGLLVLDPLRDIHTGKENESDDMSAVFARLRLLGTLIGCTVLVVHHAKKPSRDQEEQRAGHDARGSSAIYGALDALIALRDLQGDGEVTFSNTVKSEVKGAKSAGTVHLTLKLEDGSDGTAERATWTIGKPQSETSASLMSEVLADALQHLLTCEIRKDRVQTTELIRKAVSRKLEIVAAALIEGERSGLALKNMVGSRHVGWLITEAGREYVRAANKPAESPSTPGLPAPAPASAPAPEAVPFWDLT